MSEHHTTDEMRRRNRRFVLAIAIAIGLMLAISTLVGLGPT